MTEGDLISHKSSFVTPLAVKYRGVNVHEIPPNGQVSLLVLYDPNTTTNVFVNL